MRQVGTGEHRRGHGQVRLLPVCNYRFGSHKDTPNLASPQLKTVVTKACPTAAEGLLHGVRQGGRRLSC